MGIKALFSGTHFPNVTLHIHLLYTDDCFYRFTVWNCGILKFSCIVYIVARGNHQYLGKGGVWPAHYHESLSAILCDKCQGKQKAQHTDNNGCHWHRAWHQSLFCVFCGCHRFLLCIRCILICSALTRFHFFITQNITIVDQWLSAHMSWF